MKFLSMKNVFGLLALSLAAVSCSTDDGAYYQQQPQVAYGVIVNASPDSGDLFFFADTNPVNTNGLNYTDAYGYYNFYPGERVLSVRNNLGETVATDTVTMEVGKIYSAFAVNRYENLEIAVYEDSLDYPSANKARVRFINLSPDAALINVADTTGNLASLQFKDASSYMDITAGTGNALTFTDAETGEVLFSSTTAEFQVGRIYTLYTKGYIQPEPGSNDSFSTELIQNY